MLGNDRQQTTGRRWAVLLAAGAGTRLASVTTGAGGVAVPKQYCSLDGERSLLGDARARARRVVADERIVTIVAAEHQPWWSEELPGAGRPDVVVQPRNRGTAAGVLLPLLEILDRDPDAVVAYFPSDHFVADEDVLACSVEAACRRLDEHPAALTLLGVVPDAAEPDYGWIVPAGEAGNGPRRVARFVEKPDPVAALQLLVRGGVWNTFLFVARGRALLGLFEERMPELVLALRAGRSAGPAGLDRVYGVLPSHDFSRDLLQGAEWALRVQSVPACGWTDLGTPRRLIECLNARTSPRRARSGARRTALDLAGALSGRTLEAAVA